MIKNSMYSLFWILFLFIGIMRFDLIIDTIKLLLLYLGNSSNNYIDNNTLDLFISVIFFCVLPLLVFSSKVQSFLSGIKITFSTFTVTLLLFLLLFAPLVTDYNPNFQKDIKVTRFLPPLTSKNIIYLISLDEDESLFVKLKKRVVKFSTNANLVYLDSLRKEENSFIIFQGNDSKRIAGKDIFTRDGVPKIENKTFIFGTDDLGRDIFTRVIYGARTTLFVASLTIILSIIIGVSLGFLASFFGGSLDIILNRVTDVFLTIPYIFFIIMILALWGNSIFAVIMVLALTGWMGIFKIVKGEVAAIVQKDYFIASHKIGLSSYVLLIYEVIPAIVVQLAVAVVFQFSNVILAEASLSYLGLGVGINYPSWGNMILSGQKYMAEAWWLLAIPSIMLVLVLLAVNSFGEKIKKTINPIIANDK